MSHIQCMVCGYVLAAMKGITFSCVTQMSLPLLGVAERSYLIGWCPQCQAVREKLACVPTVKDTKQTTTKE